ncbi:hypothetical protein ACFVTM_11015 [Arthrobacter sp. NPDC058130]|uniref:hypothetical protein n=1 Tax=Arthrobacter sp. NPDC058130 TaxID=3346353 RepID=UPI0036EAB95E
MKTTTAITLALLTLLLTACSASPNAEPSASSNPGPSTALSASLPKPNPAQQEALLAALAGINPRLPSDQAVDKARSLCGRLLGLAPAEQLIAAAKAEFSGGDLPAVSDEDAQRIISAIGANGFCR